MNYDIAIIGGGIMGSFTAYFLSRTGAAGSVVVIEPDSTYERAATPKGAGGVRQLFSQPENIRMSKYSLKFYKDFAATMSIDDVAPDIDFNQRGYLFVAGDAGAHQLEVNVQQQLREGVNAELLDRPALKSKFPSLGVDDLTVGCFSPDDATLTTASVLDAVRNKAMSLGVDYLEDRVTALTTDGTRVQSATLASGASVHADMFVNTAGAWAPQIAAMVDAPLPVVPLCRVKHFWTCQDDIEPLPLIKDETALFLRPSGGGFIGGCPSWEIQSGFSFAPDGGHLTQYFEGYFERVVRPLLAVRVPSFRTAQCQQSWTGHYAQNTLDGNMILGHLGDTVSNMYVACGFSGHGTMHAPAVGRALSELMLDGHFSTIGLDRMSYQRVLDNAPYAEQGIV